MAIEAFKVGRARRDGVTLRAFGGTVEGTMRSRQWPWRNLSKCLRDQHRQHGQQKADYQQDPADGGNNYTGNLASVSLFTIDGDVRASQLLPD